VDPDARLRWLLEHRLLEKPFLRHEVFGLLQSSFPTASDETKQAVWEQAWAANEASLPEDVELEPTFAVWISRIDPGFEPAATAVATFAERHPYWQPSEHPDFLSWIEAGWRPTAVAIPPTGKERSFDALRRLELEDTSSLTHAELRDAIGAAVADDPSYGVELLEGVASASAWDSVLWNGAIYGLQRAAVLPDLWPRLLTVVQAHPDANIALEGLSTVLLEAIRTDPPRIDPDSFHEAATTIHALIERFIDEGSDTGDPRGDLMFDALNSWPGRIAQYLTQTAAQLEKEGEEPCAAPGLAPYLQRVQAGGEANWAQVATAALGRLFPYLSERCGTLVEERLIDSLSWKRPVTARAVWNGLAYARWSRQTVDKLYGHLPMAVTRLSDFEQQARHGLINTLVGIATSYGRNPLGDDGWLMPLVRDNDDSTMADFAHVLRRRLTELDDEERLALWEEWLHDYWNRRQQGFPRAFGPEEGSAMLFWVLPLASRLEEVAPLALQLPVAPRSWGFLHDLDESGLATSAPNTAVRLVHHVLAGAEQLFDAQSVTSLLTVAHENGADPDAIGQVCNELVRLGVPPLDICP